MFIFTAKCHRQIVYACNVLIFFLSLFSQKIISQSAGEMSGAQFDAVVDKYHKQYTSALLKLFEDHREKFAKEAADMKLVE